MTSGITAWATYIPRPRLERSAIASAHQWVAPSLKGLAKGRRAYCSWDEDIVTMALSNQGSAMRPGAITAISGRQRPPTERASMRKE